MKNKYCDLNDISNEADVETFFVLPLLADLGFNSKNIKPKHSLAELSVKSLGSRRAMKYRPDFAIKLSGQLPLIVEAKAPNVNIEDHVLQARDYSMTLNGAHEFKKPVRFFLITNGNLTQLYKVDLNKPILELSFKDFSDSSIRFKKLKALIDKESLSSPLSVATEEESLELVKAPLKDINEAFAWCHQFIYKNDNISQGAAFMEFVKIIALKLLSDRKIRDTYNDTIQEAVFRIPLSEVQFSSKLLAAQEKHTPNPLSTIWFADFIKTMEREISEKKKKRIFTENDEIKLSPETISGVVGRLQGLFLFGIDADLNGRLFETFLSATMRGKDLGQYFTPRSLVKLGVGLGQLRVDAANPDATDRVYDGCCGTGGFLIDVLADMWSKVNSNDSLSNQQKDHLRQKIANNHIFGADIGRDPNLCRIARLNMYLHGDGGSSIFNVDALDKELPESRSDTPELALEKAQMRGISETHGGAFDVVITNPPFAKAYSLDRDKKDQPSTAARILQQYELRVADAGKERNELRSNLMFMERYRDILKKGGRLVTVIDDGILSGRDHQWFRSWLKREFLINAVVSLPGDAFQRSAARVKTSFLVLTKKHSEQDIQPNAFMYPCSHVGIDDPARARTLPVDAENRKLAQKEIATVLSEYEKFLAGKKSIYAVASNRLNDRLDVKHCLMTPGENIKKWATAGFDILPVSDLLEPAIFQSDEIIDCATHDETETALVVRYDGSAISGNEIIPSETKHGKLFRVSAGQIVVSNIAASYGSIAVVPHELAGHVVSSEYTVLNVRDNFDPSVLWAVLRSPVVLSEILLVATGANRTRVKWEAMRLLNVPYPTKTVVQKFSKALSQAAQTERIAKKQKQEEIDGLVGVLLLKTDNAVTILSAFKPPK